MSPRSSARLALVGLAVGVLLALLLAPQTRGLVRLQLIYTGWYVGSPAAQGRRDDDARARVAAQHPDDYQLQLAAPQGDGGRLKHLAYLRTLTPRFGANPSLYANLLRYEIRADYKEPGVYLSREEDWLMGSMSLPKDYHAVPPDPALLAAFDADAARGEQLDPDNAYFPLMRAIGLFAARRDAEGIAAVKRASTRHVWREYMDDEVNGRLRLMSLAYGQGPAISAIAVYASMLYPQYSPLRGVARLVTYKAGQAELAGNREQGMAMRRALMRCGDLMRVQGQAYIGNLVGTAIAATANHRPGGAPSVKLMSQHMTSNQQVQAQMDAFQDYARRIGHPEDGRRMQAEYTAWKAMHTIGTRGLAKSILSPGQAMRDCAFWAGSLLTLVSVLWFLALGVAAVPLSRLPTVRARQPMPRAAQLGVVAGLGTGAIFLALATGGTGVGIALLVCVTGLLAALALAWMITPAARRAARREQSGRFSRSFAVSGLALLALAALGAWQMRFGVEFARAQMEMTGAQGYSAATPGGPEAFAMEAVAVAVSLALPLLMVLVLAIAGRARRVPVSVALVEGFRAGALPVACVLVVVYGAFALATLRQERVMDNGLRQMIRHEGRYYASLAGMPWPGPVE